VQEGDTINMSAGTCIWNQALDIGEPTPGVFKAVPGFKLVGAGEGVTIIQRGSSFTNGFPNGLMVVEILATSGLTELTAFTIDATSSLGVPLQGYINLYGSGLDKFRVHHITLDNMANKGIAIYGNRSATGNTLFTGLVDHITCNIKNNGDCFVHQGTWTTNQRPFTFSPSLGSNQAVYFEDNTITYSVV